MDTMKILNPEDEDFKPGRKKKQLKFNHFNPTIKSKRC